MPTRIKLCGITRAVDAALGVSLGVDMLGIVFYPPSPRNVSAAQAREIRRAVPATTQLVGVFVDAEPQALHDAFEEFELDVVQLHGHESDRYCQDLGLPYIKAIPAAEARAGRLQSRYLDARALLIDSKVGEQFGGTGVPIDTADWPGDLRRPLMLAGGLTPGNVVAALAATGAAGIDASSGVERAPGVKDHALIEALVAAVRDYDAGSGSH